MKTPVGITMLVGILLVSLMDLFVLSDNVFSQNLPGSAILSPKMNKVLIELENFNRTDRMLNVPRTDGLFLRMLAEMIGAKRVLEIGTSNGYSTIWIGLSVKGNGGTITTLEIDPEKVRMARENFKKAGLDDIITVIEGDALKTTPAVEGPFDFVFIDAWKSDYKKYFDIVFPKVEKGGVIVGHNAIAHEKAMKDFLDEVKNHPDLETVVLSTTGRDGMSVSYKIR